MSGERVTTSGEDRTHSRREFLARTTSALLLGAGAPTLLLDAGAPALLDPGAQALRRRSAEPASLSALRRAVRGRVLTPGMAGYDGARVVFNQRFDDVRPPAVVQVRDVADVQAVVRWANHYDVPLVPRSGGNAYNGASTSASAVIVDLRALRGISLSGQTATIGPAARNIDVYATLAARGVAVPSGSCPNVAIGGLATGGGMGLSARALGLLLDHVRGFDVVTADGQRRRVDSTSEQELFWALRGGGGSFAIVTAVRLRVHRVNTAAWFFTSFPQASREQALAAWDELAPDAPEALTAICTLTATGATAFGQYFGSERALGLLVAGLAGVPGARSSIGTASYLDLQRRWAGCGEAAIAACARVPRTTFDASSLYIARRLSAQARGAFVAAADGGATLICDAYGGAINRVSPGATAFVHRRARFSVQIVSYAPLDIARARVRRARALIAPYGNGQAYQNYADLDLAHPLRAYYGANHRRLVRVKTQVDPQDRFRLAQGIRPGGTR